MYLVSIYFDEKTNNKIQAMIDRVAEKTGNYYMKEAHVPPHLTLSAFETREEEAASAILARVAGMLRGEHIQWVSVGQFLPQVLFITPVLNRYLHHMGETVFREFSQLSDVKFSPYYRPFSWQPHTTIAKKLKTEEMQCAFRVMQNQFEILEGTVVKIGLAKPNPYREISSFDLLVK